MHPWQFLAEFGHIAKAPGGVARLRELVLQLAISGHLVERGSPETPVGDAVAAATESREAYERQMELRASHPHPPIDATPYIIPEHWKWVRLEALSRYIQRGKGPKYATRGQVYVASQKCVQWTGFDLKQARFITDESLSDYGPERFLQDGDLLWNSTGTGTAGRVAIYRKSALAERTVADSHVTVIRLSHEAALPRYLWCVIVSPWIQARIQPSHPDSLVSGTTEQVDIARSTARALPIPCPPIEEQARIVAKVDELMALCDKVEAQHQRGRRAQNVLRQSTLQVVARAESPQELQHRWERLHESFGRLFSAPEDVEPLRGAILDLAVHGLLVEQRSSDEPIRDWLEHIARTKAALLKSKQIAKQTPLAAVAERDYPFAAPTGWTFVRLGQIANKIGSGSTPRGGREVYVKVGVPFLRSQNVWNDGLRMQDIARITPEEHARMSSTAVRGNDILLNITGASLGRCALVPPDFGEANVSQHVTIIRPTDPRVREYLHLCIVSPYTQAMIWGRQVGAAREGLSKKVLEQFEIPLPPLAEQQRIVARVAELMRICDVFEQQLRQAREVAQRLASAAVSALTGITFEHEEDEPVKVPETELIAPLRLNRAPESPGRAPLAHLLAVASGELRAKDLWVRSGGGDLGVFYAQLKTEIEQGFIEEPGPAAVREILTDRAAA